MPPEQLYRTYPDFGITPSEYIPADIDNAELAARIGSIDTYRREGRVLSVADFSPSLNGWSLERDCIITADGGFNGNACVLFNASASSGLSYIQKQTSTGASLRLGLSCYIRPRAVSYHKTYLKISRNNGGDLYAAGEMLIEHEYGVNRVSYFNSSNSFTVIETVTEVRNTTWFNLKLVCDFSANKYARIYINHVDYLASIDPKPDLYTSAGGLNTRKNYYFDITATNSNSNPVNVLVDSAIITVHEY